MSQSSRQQALGKAHPAPSAAARPDIRSIFLLVFMALVAFGVYTPAFQGKWLMSWDDNFMVVDNPNLRDAAGLWNIWVAAPGYDYWPLSSTLLWIEWHLFGREPFGYHVVAFMLHLFSGVLVWRLLARLGLKWGWFGGLIFLVHPLAVESVAWISEVKNVLSLPLFLLATLSYLSFDERGKNADYGEALLFFIAAMLAKTAVVMLPFVLLLYLWWKRGPITLTDMKRTAPFFLVAIILGGVTIAMQAPTPLTELPAPRTPLEVFLTAGQVIYFYLGSFLAPFRLAVIYPRWSLAEPTLLQLALWPLLIVLLVLLVQQKAWGRHVLLGLGFFILTLVPVLGFVHFTFMKFSWVADHFAYLPMIGLVGLVVAGIEALSVWLPSDLRRPVLMVLLAGILYGEMVTTGERDRAFADERTLWETTLAQNPQAVPAYNNLGLLAMNRRDYAEAITLFRQAVQLQPNYVEGRDNIAVCQSAQGDVAGAISTLNESKAINPNNALTFYELGTLDLHAGRFNDALGELQTAVRLNPRDINAHFNLGLTLLHLGRSADAAHEFENVLSLSPGLPIAQQMLEKAQAASATAPTGT